MGSTGNLKSKKRNVSASKLSREAIFGPAPVLPGGDSDAYNSFAADISSTVGPSNIIEKCWVRDIVDLTWDIFRCRRHKVRLVESAAAKALEEVLAPLVNGTHRFGAMEKWRVDGSLEPTPAMELYQVPLIRTRWPIGAIRWT